MALVTLPGGFYIPPQMGHVSAASFVILGTQQSADNKFAIILQVPKSGVLDWFEIRQNTNTTTPNPGLTFSFQDLSGHDPDGTIDEFRNLTTGFGTGNWLVPPGVMTDDGTDGGVKRTVTRGDFLACVVSFTPTYVAGSVSFSLLSMTTASGVSVPGTKYMYGLQFTTSWQNPGVHCPILALKYSDGSYAQFPSIITPLASLTPVNFNSGTSPNHRGILFSLPAPVRANGVYFMSTTGGDLDIILYDAADNILTTVSIPATLGRIATQMYNTVLFPSSVDLSKDTNYRLIIKPTSVTNVSLTDWFANSTALRAAFPMGASRQLTHGAPGSWTEEDTSYGTDMGLIIDAIDDGSNGGGGGEHSFVFQS